MAFEIRSIIPRNPKRSDVGSSGTGTSLKVAQARRIQITIAAATTVTKFNMGWTAVSGASVARVTDHAGRNRQISINAIAIGHHSTKNVQTNNISWAGKARAPIVDQMICLLASIAWKSPPRAHIRVTRPETEDVTRPTIRGSGGWSCNRPSRMRLSRWQRIKRRVKLLGGSYTHPDGTIELDFEAAAGIDPFVDSEEVQDKKLARYYARQRASKKIAGALLVAAGVFWAAQHTSIPVVEALGIAAVIAMGLWNLCSDGA